MSATGCTVDALEVPACAHVASHVKQDGLSGTLLQMSAERLYSQIIDTMVMRLLLAWDVHRRLWCAARSRHEA